MPVVTIRHTTRYTYHHPVGFGEHRIMFRPHEGDDQQILDSRLTISPAPSALRHVRDVFGNGVSIARFDETARELTFVSEVTLEHTPCPLGADDDVSAFPIVYDADDLPDLTPSLAQQHADPDGELAHWAHAFLRPDGSTSVLAALSDMTRTIHTQFGYAQRLSAGCQTPLQTLGRNQGTCRDFALLMVEAARTLGLAARFVSGYVYSAASAGLAPSNPARKGGGHTHAWATVYLPARGWVEFDPTNGIIGNTDLIRVAVVRDPVQASPLHGSYDGEAEDFASMQVEVELNVHSPVERQAEPLRRVA
ncbi:MAG: transglutaminase family protein [Caulobacteraceae bacterium]